MEIFSVKYGNEDYDGYICHSRGYSFDEASSTIDRLLAKKS